jgi:hypothetical protein
LIQQKSLLIIDGSVKSGKTTLARVMLPFLLHDRDILKKNFCFGYIDLSSLHGCNTIEEKWKALNVQFKQLFKDQWLDVRPDLPENSFPRFLESLRALKETNTYWIISLDEFHFLFSELSEKNTATIAEQIKLTLLDNESPCYFVLAGSTQATFWWSFYKPRPNGLNLLTGATILTTHFQSSVNDIETCKRILKEKKNAQEKELNDIIQLLQLKTVANIMQVITYYLLLN